ncbi:hypothetical protein D3C85_1403680 [compost metagenome]
MELMIPQKRSLFGLWEQRTVMQLMDQTLVLYTVWHTNIQTIPLVEIWLVDIRWYGVIMGFKNHLLEMESGHRDHLLVQVQV